ncbi:USP6 N-terminal-like protein [Canis lupus baileyi]|uniref:USP6 N-terminal-like protein n=1 Tax=Canis lupus baileyi TaxID=143281 RepID=UPI003B9758CC
METVRRLLRKLPIELPCDRQTFGDTCAPDLACRDPTLLLSPVAQYSYLLIPQCIKRRRSQSDRSQGHSLASPPTIISAPAHWETSPPSVSTMQEDPETLLALQRANIVAQYHQAHQAGSPQDLSLCKVTDHQGFLQDKELSGPSPCEAKKLRQETQRVDKWIKMLKRWDHYLPSEKEMKEAALVSSRDIMQIDLDVNRTFRSHTMFWDRYRVGQGALFHMLAAYSVNDTEVGYCQGMSEIAAILLMFLPEEDAFWALA